MAVRNQAKVAKLQAKARALDAAAARNGRLSTSVKAEGKRIKADRRQYG